MAQDSKEAAPAASISFIKDIAPVFVQKCLTCHGPEKAKGEYRLDTFEWVMQAGASEAASVVAGDPEQSELFRRIVTQDEDDRMPQKDDRLAEPLIAAIRQWIQEGARFDGSDPKAPLATLIPRAPHPEPPERYSHPVPVTALAFSPDGGELAVSGYHEVTIWSVEDGKLLRRIKNVAQRIQGLAFSPDGSRLAVVGGHPGRHGEAVLIDLKQKDTIRTLGVMSDVMLDVCFKPDGSELAVAGADNTIHLYEVASGRERLAIQQHADWVMAIDFDAEGNHLASASRDRSARVYDSQTGELQISYNDHGVPLFAVGFNGDGKRVFSAGRDKRILQWNAGDAKRTREIGGFGGEVTRILVRDGNVFSASTDQTVRQHSAADGKLVFSYSGHEDWIYALAYHAPAKRLASGSYDGEVRLWNTAEKKLIISFIAAPGLGAEAQPATRARQP